MSFTLFSVFPQLAAILPLPVEERIVPGAISAVNTVSTIRGRVAASELFSSFCCLASEGEGGRKLCELMRREKKRSFSESTELTVTRVSLKQRYTKMFWTFSSRIMVA